MVLFSKYLAFLTVVVRMCKCAMSPIGHVFERSVSADGMALKGDEPSGDRVLLEEASPEILHSLTVYSLLSYVNAIKSIVSWSQCPAFLTIEG